MKTIHERTRSDSNYEFFSGRFVSFRGPFLSFSGVAIICAFSLLTGCSKSEKTIAEAPARTVTVEAPPAPVTAPVDQSRLMPKLPPPQINEVQEAVKRVFKEAVFVDTNQKPAFIVGDFNGDLSQDIAVVLKPAADKLPELNQEFANWLLRDLGAAPDQTASPQLHVAANDKLLAIIHGHDVNGWRDHQATQTYLLKNAAYSGMEAYSAKEFVAVYRGRKLPQLRGDVVGQETGGKLRCIYYSGATYSWYDPKTFNEETAQSVVHMAPKAMKK
jgi:hypothetical protein